MSQKLKVIELYKSLLYMGRDYPLGYPYFKEKCHAAFFKNKDESDPIKIKKLILHGKYIVKELEALYAIKKYRTLKKRYYDTEISYQDQVKKIENGVGDVENK